MAYSLNCPVDEITFFSKDWVVTKPLKRDHMLFKKEL